MLRHLVAEISRFKFDDYREIRTGASDLKLFWGGVYWIKDNWENCLILRYTLGCIYLTSILVVQCLQIILHVRGQFHRGFSMIIKIRQKSFYCNSFQFRWIRITMQAISFSDLRKIQSGQIIKVGKPEVSRPTKSWKLSNAFVYFYLLPGIGWPECRRQAVTYLSSWYSTAHSMYVNPLRAKFFRGNIDIYLHFV